MRLTEAESTEMNMQVKKLECLGKQFIVLPIETQISPTKTKTPVQKVKKVKLPPTKEEIELKHQRKLATRALYREKHREVIRQRAKMYYYRRQHRLIQCDPNKLLFKELQV